MTKPDHMLIEPYDYQLRGAAHIHHGCLGPFAGMILADPGGLGKTIQAMLAIYLDRDLPGKSLVVVPEGFFVDEWLEEFGKVWEQVVFQLRPSYHKKANLFIRDMGQQSSISRTLVH